MVKRKHIQSAASDDAAVHIDNGQGFPPHPGRRAAEYRRVDKILTCEPCMAIELEELHDEEAAEMHEAAANHNNGSFPELDDAPTDPDEITPFGVKFEYIDPASKNRTVIIVKGVEGETAQSAIENAVGKMKVTVIRKQVWVFDPTEE